MAGFGALEMEAAPAQDEETIEGLEAEKPEAKSVDLALGAAFDAMQDGNREAFIKGIRAAYDIWMADSDMR